MEKEYNKLVRDKMPDIIKDKGNNPITKVLDTKEYKIELKNNLLEGYKKFFKTNVSDARIDVLADMLEIINSLANLENKTLKDIERVADLKRQYQGSFQEKIYLEKVIDNK